MKYNKSEIMKEAWKLFKSCTPNHRAPFGRYLHLAWERARKEAEKAQRMASRQQFTGFATICIPGIGVADFRLWQNYGKRRVYCTAGFGGSYVDLDHGNALIVKDKSSRVFLERFLETYLVA